MGIKTKITRTQLPKKYQNYKLLPTTNGVMASVYLLDDVYVLKLFEKDTSVLTIESEIKLLNKLKNLAVPKVVDRFQIDGYEVIIYTQVKGEIHFEASINDVKEIGKFLKEFHAQSKDIQLESKQLFQKDRLIKLIKSTGEKRLKKHYNLINLTLENDGAIHGDLFPDNCKFMGKELSGVYDFSDACLGDFHFELAVVTVAWCFDNNKLNMKKGKALFEAYKPTRNTNNFMEYVKYALLYYATTRFIAGHDYEELLVRLESLKICKI